MTVPVPETVDLTWEQVVAIISAFASFLTACGVVWSVVYNAARTKAQTDLLWDQNNKTKDRQETIWSFLMRRAQSETVQKNYASFTPRRIHIEENVFDIIPVPMQEKMVSKFAGKHSDLTDGQFMLEIEKYFGDDLLHEVCIPNGLVAGACLMIAADFIRKAEMNLVSSKH